MAPSVWYWLACVVNPVEDHFLALASWIQNVFIVTFCVGLYHCQSVSLFRERITRVSMDFYKHSFYDAAAPNLRLGTMF